MVKKYARYLEERQINSRTEEIWNIEDVPALWRTKVEAQIYIDGYKVDTDGTVVPREKED